MPPLVPTYTAARVRAAEEPLLAAGVPLMMRAAQALAEVIREHGPECVLVLAGAGNNGGDALFAAAEIAAEGTRVDVLCVADAVHGEGLRAAIGAGARVIELDGLGSYHLVVDGILGIGARGALRGRACEAVGVLQPRQPLVIAVDLPSGLDPDTGEADAAVFTASTTVTFGAVKAGLVLGEGPRLSGRIVLVELGLELGEPVGEAEIAEVRRVA